MPLQYLLDDSLGTWRELKTALITLLHKKKNNNNAIYLSVNVSSTKVLILLIALLLHQYNTIQYNVLYFERVDIHD